MWRRAAAGTTPDRSLARFSAGIKTLDGYDFDFAVGAPGANTCSNWVGWPFVRRRRENVILACPSGSRQNRHLAHCSSAIWRLRPVKRSAFSRRAAILCCCSRAPIAKGQEARNCIKRGILSPESC